MTKTPQHDNPLPGHVAAIVDCGFATWAYGSAPAGLERQFEDRKIPVENVRLVRVWGLQISQAGPKHSQGRPSEKATT